MLPSSVVLGLGGTLLLTVADKVPSLNVEPACRAAAKMGDSLSLDTTLRQCLADEKSARDQLEKEWTQFAPALQQRCVATTQTGGDPVMSKSLYACRWGATPARSTGLRQAAGKTTDNDADRHCVLLIPLGLVCALGSQPAAAHSRATHAAEATHTASKTRQRT